MRKSLLAVCCGFLMAIAGVGLFTAPVSAVSICTPDNSSCAAEYSNWGGVQSQDTDCDGDPVYAEWQRDVGTVQRTNNSSGCGSTESSGVDNSNRIKKMKSCTDDWFGDTCSGWVNR